MLSVTRRGDLPLIIGHRGAAGLAPENTLVSFKRAWELGADLIECDVHFSRDRRLVVTHDENVDRTTNGFGLVRELSVDELRTLDAGQGQRLLLLDELLAWVRKTDLAIVIEAKGNLSVYPGISEAIIQSIESQGLFERTIVISFDYAILEELKDLQCDLATGVLLGWPITGAIDTARRLQADVILPGIHLIDREMAAEARGQGLGVCTWTVNRENQLRHALSCGVDAIGTDYPDWLRGCLSTHQRLLQAV